MPLPGRLLALRPLVWVGLISYSLYLWHWPLFAFLKHYGLASENPVTRLLLAGAALVPAWLSYRFIETPFRRKNLLPTTRQAFLFGGLTAASLTAAATAVILTRGAENRLPPEVVRIVRDSEPMPFWSELKPSDVPSKLVPFGSSTGTITLFVWGDSHAMAILPAVDAVTRELGIRGFAATHSATVPTVGYYTRSAWGLNERSPAFNRRVLDHILSTAAGPHQVGVLLAARWTRHMPPSRIGAFQRALAGTVDELTRANVSVFILKEVPGFSYSPPKMIVAAALLGRPLENIRQPLAEHRARTATQDLIFARLHQPDLSLIDLAPVYTDPDGLINPLDDGGSLWRDNHHLSVHGSLKAEDTLRQALQSLVPAPESSLR